MIRFISVFLITSLIFLFVSILEVKWRIRNLSLKKYKKIIDEAGTQCYQWIPDLLNNISKIYGVYKDIKIQIIISFITTITFLIVTFSNLQLQSFISLSVPVSFFSLGLIVFGIIVRKSVFHKLEKENLLPIFPFFKKTLF